MLLKPIGFNRAETGGAGGSAPTVFSQSASVSDVTGTTSLPWPTHAADDVAYLAVVNRGSDQNPPNISTPTDFNALGSAIAVGVNSVDAVLHLFWSRADSASEPNVAIDDGGQRTLSFMTVVRGAITSGTPHISFTSTTSSSGTAVSIPGGASGGDNRLVLDFLGIVDLPVAGDPLSAGFTNSSLTSVSNVVSYNTISNQDYGLAIGQGTIASSGTISATTATLTSSTNTHAGLKIAITPAA